MARSRGGINWTYDTLTPRMAVFAITANIAISAACTELAQEIEEWMKENASWEDRTGAAREGLTAKKQSQGFRQVIYLYHTVDYGIWLEVRWNGKYAIIVPALEHFDSLMTSKFTGLMGGFRTSGGKSLLIGAADVAGSDFGEGGEE